MATQSYYAVHSGKTAGVFGSWSEMQSEVRGVSNPVFAKFESRPEALHFVEHGVQPWRRDTRTKHIFVSSDETRYSIYSATDAVVGHVPPQWYCTGAEANAARRRELSGLLALSKCLELCASSPEYAGPVVVHFEHAYPYNCISWIEGWKKRSWTKKDGLQVANRPLLEIIDAQRCALGGVHFHHVPNEDVVAGIGGFRRANAALRKAPPLPATQPE